MFTKQSLRYVTGVAVLFGSFYVINNVFGGIGVLIAGAVTFLYVIRTGAGETIAHFFEWATGLIVTPTG